MRARVYIAGLIALGWWFLLHNEFELTITCFVGATVIIALSPEKGSATDQ